MPAWLNNPWVVGIGAGILSGIIVTLVSRTILSRRDRREYVQKVLSANREVIYAVRPGIAEALVPSADILTALVSATARKYGVDEKDLYQPKEIAQELTKEVMDSSFISPKTKEEYCAHLAPLHAAQAAAAAPVGLALVELRERIRVTESARYRARTVTMMSMMMGALAGTMTVLVAFIQFRESTIDSRSLIGSRDLGTLLLPALLAILVTATAAFVTLTRRDLEKRTARKREQVPLPEPESETSHPRDAAP